MIINKMNQFASINERDIYDALYSTLVYLKPKYCLEIGTFHGKSAEVFQKYFDIFCTDGLLITIDIHKYVDLSWADNIKQLIVHPHIQNSSEWHYVDNNQILPYTADSVTQNIAQIKTEISNQFDFCFLDGDHTMESVTRDFQIARQLLSQPQYILFDDIDSEPHDSVKYYNQFIKNNNEYNVYSFDNWTKWVGAALVSNKQPS